jgi:branched-subunit amino acid aminotransferase/4-amino-4-deoxychorismate lyase
MQPSFGDFPGGDGLPSGRLRLLLALDAEGDAWQALGEWGPHRSSAVSLDSGIDSVMASFPHPGLGHLGKSASYHWSIAARREALARGAGEALLARDGRVLEGSTGAIVWRQDGRWWTEASDAVLASVTLAELRAAGVEIAEGTLSVAKLAGDAAPVEGLVLVSALRLAVAIRKVEGQAVLLDAALAAAAEWRALLLARHAQAEAQDPARGMA